MSDYVPKERAQTQRLPSSANLMIDSADRDPLVSPLANDFSIQRANSILNGFFTRVGTTELVLEWFTPNFSPIDTPGSVDFLTISYTTPDVAESTFLVPSAFFTQADLIDWVLRFMNVLGASFAPPVSWSIVVAPSPLAASGVTVRLVPATAAPDVTIAFSGSVARRLGLPTDARVYRPGLDTITIFAADLRLYRYIDFVSTQLTNNQSLKDASTAQIVRDVLARWYFADDQPPVYDQYGFPILQGYTPFVTRRTFSPPKQIRWEPNIPIGNLTFQVYNPQGTLALMNSVFPTQAAFASQNKRKSEWLMTLQVSEN